MAADEDHGFIMPTRSIANEITKHLSASNFDGSERVFLPDPWFSQVITLETIEHELDRFAEGRFLVREDLWGSRCLTYNRDFRKQLATWIFQKAAKTFAIMVYCNLNPLFVLSSMDTCRELGFTDQDLPLMNRSEPPKGWLRHIWTETTVQDFWDKQWRFLVPVFKPEQYEYDHEDNCIFPFTKAKEPPRIGAFSAVHRIKIHPDHQKHEGGHEFAIKDIHIPEEAKTETDIVWVQEARALEYINDIDHPHITRCIAAIRRGTRRYFMFPWADGDSLRDHWKRIGQRGPDEPTIRHAVEQLRGLADALDRLHHYKRPKRNIDTDVMNVNGSNRVLPKLQVEEVQNENIRASLGDNIRHGDLKPENILCFGRSGSGCGTLKIADMGLAKRHIQATEYRNLITTTRYGTIQYEAPEAAPVFRRTVRSRLYDIWSMGCITLEMIIWILYGNETLNEFYTQLRDSTTQLCHYYKVESGPKAVIHPVVRQWISHMKQNDPECSQSSAINDLLKIVEEKLLVVKLPRRRNSTGGNGMEPATSGSAREKAQSRCTAAEFRDALDAIMENMSQSSDYVLVGKSRFNIKNISPKHSQPSNLGALYTRDGGSLQQTNGLLEVLSNRTDQTVKTGDYFLPPLKDWVFEIDNEFAARMSDKLTALFKSQKRGKLCSRCLGINFWAAGFNFSATMAELRANASACDFCSLLVKVCENNNNVMDEKIHLERKQSNLTLLDSSYPILSIFRSPDADKRVRVPRQIGPPELPEPGSDEFFAILNGWLQRCCDNTRHKDCQASSVAKPPTRLIDVGTADRPMLRLVESAIEELVDGRYLALSHRWGNIKPHKPFSTLPSDKTDAGHDLAHFRRAIPEDQLPSTFKDAIICTRKLGVRYLWIDSLCILQGEDGDFNIEAKRMEDVYSGALCVIAASRASSQLDGFLKPRPKRDYVTFQRHGEKPFYVCKTIDNFSKDVIEGPLNKRGWVLQERALARRTIYFAENQTYFECGKGIRCESMTYMHNKMAGFLGDPRFPLKSVNSSSTRALKISCFQEIYKQYSRLEFTRPEDRAFGIAGLEKRLLAAFGFPGGYGLFDDGTTTEGGLFHRSLLWRRGAEADAPEMLKIDFSGERNIRIPTWSWMAYTGGIDYADPPHQEAEWEMSDIVPPWTRGDIQFTSSAPLNGFVAIQATVRNYVIPEGTTDEVELVFDRTRTSRSEGRDAYCVVVARSRQTRPKTQGKRYYVLLVSPTHQRTDRNMPAYERIGVGYVLEEHIALNSSGISAAIL